MLRERYGHSYALSLDNMFRKFFRVKDLEMELVKAKEEPGLMSKSTAKMVTQQLAKEWIREKRQVHDFFGRYT